MSNALIDPDFDILMLGTDIGIYALARAFHERYGKTSTVVAKVVAGPIKNSNFIDTIELGDDGERADTLAELQRQGEMRKAQGRTTLLMYNADGFARMVTDNEEFLSQWFVVTAISNEVLDIVADKIEFGRICDELDIPTPRTLVQNFADADSATWQINDVDLTFPVVAKPAVGGDYEGLRFEGKKKIYEVSSPEELVQVFHAVRDGGYRGRFVVQELIPGDDTAMRSITAYVDQRGEVTLMASAQVLLQEHTPLAIGNPAAMVTTAFPELMAHAERLLKHVNYRGFANFDVKIDPRDGTGKFFEVNPRIGRNNYYVTAAGANVAEFITADLIEDRAMEQVIVRNEILYTVVPLVLLRRYLNPDLKALVKRVTRKGVFNPMVNDDSVKRRLYSYSTRANHFRKYAKYYPKPTESGF